MAGARARVLIVEDEVLITLLLEDMLIALECDVTDIAVSLEGALSAAQTGVFDLALLDLTLAGKLSYPVADILRVRQIPFAFVTGHRSAGVATAYAGTPILEKPFHREDLAAVIAQILVDPSA